MIKLSKVSGAEGTTGQWGWVSKVCNLIQFCSYFKSYAQGIVFLRCLAHLAHSESGEKFVKNLVMFRHQIQVRFRKTVTALTN